VNKRLMIRADLARHFNVNPSQVGRWITAGLPTLRGGKYIDPEAAERWLARNVNPEKRIMCQATKAAAAASARVAERPYRGKPAVPPGCGHLQNNIVQAAIVAILPALAYRVPRLAAMSALAAADVPWETAETIYRYVAVGAMSEVSCLLTAIDVPPPPAAGSWEAADMWSTSDFAPLEPLKTEPAV
jgi:hypothetical protein